MRPWIIVAARKGALAVKATQPNVPKTQLAQLNPNFALNSPIHPVSQLRIYCHFFGASFAMKWYCPPAVGYLVTILAHASIFRGTRTYIEVISPSDAAVATAPMKATRCPSQYLTIRHRW